MPYSAVPRARAYPVGLSVVNAPSTSLKTVGSQPQCSRASCKRTRRMWVSSKSADLKAARTTCTSAAATPYPSPPEIYRHVQAGGTRGQGRTAFAATSAGRLGPPQSPSDGPRSAAGRSARTHSHDQAPAVRCLTPCDCKQVLHPRPPHALEPTFSLRRPKSLVLISCRVPRCAASARASLLALNAQHGTVPRNVQE